MQSYLHEIDKRSRRSKLPSLRLRGLPGNDFEVRVWAGFGLTLLQGFILQRKNGEWSATDIGWTNSEGPNKRWPPKPLDRKLPSPEFGWDVVWARLENLGILTLPNAAEINCEGDALDGFTYVVEYNANNEYRAYAFDNPEYATCREAKQIGEIVGITVREYRGLGSQDPDG